ncbi:exported hypothetical protein [Mesorhizobium ventifaucium]|uniref:Uncharacterized protein n=1 Tax=Mesorhizobium ventifaucium TaxID=666020 RepID=A0ABN8K9G4_9HYPH|nr:exported hypothetical protein [Mesorhizobium ventifaucium]
MFPASFASLRRKWAKISGAIMLAVALMIGAAAQAEPIRGAGSTLAAPIIGKWATAYESARADGGDYVSPDWKVDLKLSARSPASCVSISRTSTLPRPMRRSMPLNSRRPAASSFPS